MKCRFQIQNVCYVLFCWIRHDHSKHSIKLECCVKEFIHQDPKPEQKIADREAKQLFLLFWPTLFSNIGKPGFLLSQSRGGEGWWHLLEPWAASLCPCLILNRAISEDEAVHAERKRVTTQVWGEWCEAFLKSNFSATLQQTWITSSLPSSILLSSLTWSSTLDLAIEHCSLPDLPHAARYIPYK